MHWSYCSLAFSQRFASFMYVVLSCIAEISKYILFHIILCHCVALVVEIHPQADDDLTHWGWDKMAAIFADDIFKMHFFNENLRILIHISLKFVSKSPINNIPSLVQIMAWRRIGDKPLFEPMMPSLAMHICVTLPQWVNNFNSLSPEPVELYVSCYLFVFIGWKLKSHSGQIVFGVSVWLGTISHYQKQSCPRFLMPYGIIRPQ